MGLVVRKDGHYYGPALNLTARIAGHARPGEIVCGKKIAAMCTESGVARCRTRDAVRFKNLPAPVDIFEVDTAAAESHTPDPSIDPVCQMHVGTAPPPAQRSFEARTYSLCSLGCAQAFAAAPGAYLPDRQ